jgi:hypothetical protein
MEIDAIQKIADIVQKAAAAFAFIIGGAWVLMNYVRNRTHRPRLQVEIKAEVIEMQQERYILASMQIKNPGLSVITFPKPEYKGAGPRGSALLVRKLIKYRESEVSDCNWGDASAFDILIHHSSIEPALAIYEEKLLRLPDDEEYEAYWLCLRVAAQGQSWSADTIVAPRKKTPPNGQ